MKNSILGLQCGLLICLGIVTVVGENPSHVLVVLFASGLGSSYDLGQVLFYMTSLIFTGLAVFIPLRAGLFNIGAEGQLTVGALAITGLGLAWPNAPNWLAIPLAVLSGLLASGLWGYIPGKLKTWRGSHEVIVTMMMNFIAAGLASYLITGPWQSHSSQNPESDALGENFRALNWDPVHKWSPDSPVNLSILIALILCVLVYFWSERSVSGYAQKVTSVDVELSASQNINFKFYKTWSLALGGIFAGLVGMNEVLGGAGKYRLGFSPQFGFIGIAIALLAQGSALGIIPAAFLFALLQKGSSDLDLETAHITRDFSMVLQAIIILSVVYFQRRGARRV